MLGSRLLRVVGAGLVTFTIVPTAATFADTYVGETVGSRVYVYFRVPTSALQAWLPDGWTSAGFEKGPLAGSNVMLRFHESDISLGPDGKPDTSAPRLSLTLITWARNASAGKNWRIFVPLQYATTNVPDRMTNRKSAELSRRTTTSASGGAILTGSEAWMIVYGGARLSFRMGYSDVPTAYDAFRPSLHSTDVAQGYKETDIAQISGYVFSASAGTDRMTEYVLENDLPELMPLFDGTHELRAIRIVSHVRTKTYMP